jgi:hypothetical protein
MKLSDREKLLLLVAPVAVILAGYASWFNLFERAKLQAILSAHEAAVAGEPKPFELRSETARNAALARDVARWVKQKQELEARADAALGQAVDPQWRIQAGGQLTALFSAHGLQVLHEEPAVTRTESKLPRSLAMALARLGKGRSRKTSESTQVRRLQLVGRYVDLMEAVEELAQADNPPGVPIRLAMAEADADADVRSWTLWVWMRSDAENRKPDAENRKPDAEKRKPDGEGKRLLAGS